jgi:cell wall-associated NlpC family hydrolase
MSINPKLRALLSIVLTVALSLSAQARGEHDEYLLDKIKKIFSRPTPTPTPKPRKQRKNKPAPTPAASRAASPTESATPSVAPTATASPAVTPSPTPLPLPTVMPTATPTAASARTPVARPTATPTATRTPVARPTAAPTATPAKTPSSEITPTPVAEQPIAAETPSPTARREASQFIEPVRPISPGPRTRFHVTASPAPAATSPLPKAIAVPVGRPTAPPAAAIAPNEIAGFETYPPEVRRVIDLALGLTRQNLGYKYGSADPVNGGLDASGFVYYVLSKSGIKDVPRDAREQYVWARKAGNFQAVLAHRDDTFELDALRPGDLLFWASGSSVSRDPDISYIMVYLGRDKATNQRIMIGASDGRTYKGQSRFGVSVFDFKVAQFGPRSREGAAPVFVGYAHIPGLRAE